MVLAVGAGHLTGELLHNGSVDDRFDVVAAVTRVDDPLPLGLPDDLLPLEDAVEAHVRRFGLRTNMAAALQTIRRNGEPPRGWNSQFERRRQQLLDYPLSFRA